MVSSQRNEQTAIARPAQHTGANEELARGRIQHPIPQRTEEQVLRKPGVQFRQYLSNKLCLLVLGSEAAGGGRGRRARIPSA